MGVCRHCGLKEDIFPFQQLLQNENRTIFSRDISKNVEKHPSIGSGV